MKDLQFEGSSLEALKAFPQRARSEAGFQLDRVQNGLDPNDWKPMATIGSGVREIRIKAGNHYRVIYLAKDANKVYVLHAFLKKTQKTSKADIDLAKKRYKEIERLKP